MLIVVTEIYIWVSIIHFSEVTRPHLPSCQQLFSGWKSCQPNSQSCWIQPKIPRSRSKTLATILFRTQAQRLICSVHINLIFVLDKIWLYISALAVLTAENGFLPKKSSCSIMSWGGKCAQDFPVLNLLWNFVPRHRLRNIWKFMNLSKWHLMLKIKRTVKPLMLITLKL